MNQFEDLTTEKFRKRMRPHAIWIYNSLFPGCTIEDLREDGVKVHVLDKEFGIDTLATFRSGQWISIQEKYRKHDLLVNPKLQVKPGVPDFTQEYKNASGTEYERNGEWFHLGAQLYFYGWANKAMDSFDKWVLLDIAKYKLIVEENGGLERFGRLQKNSKHGSASFYCIPVTALQPAFVATHNDIPFADMIPYGPRT